MRCDCCWATDLGRDPGLRLSEELKFWIFMGFNKKSAP